MIFAQYVLPITLVAILTMIIISLMISLPEVAADVKFTTSTVSDYCPGVERLNWLNDTTLEDSVVLTPYCMFPTAREINEGCVDWHKTRLNFDKKCKELQGV